MWTPGAKCVWLAAVAVLAAALGGGGVVAGHAGHAPSSTAASPAKLRALLATIAGWIMRSGVGTNHLNNATYWDPPDAIFVNANLARVLLAAHKITGNETYAAEGLAWCDAAVSAQRPITTSTGLPGGYWDTGYGELYFGDTGTAATAIAGCHSLSGGNATRQHGYAQALAKLVNFMTDGCRQSPPKYDSDRACPPKGTGWVVGTNKDAGAIADGYNDNKLLLTPYTVATATCGATFAELSTMGPLATEVIGAGAGGKAAATKRVGVNCTALALGAVRWIANTVAVDGTIPYVLFSALSPHSLCVCVFAHRHVAAPHALPQFYVQMCNPLPTAAGTL